jgi:hypothetical protein
MISGPPTGSRPITIPPLSHEAELGGSSSPRGSQLKLTLSPLFCSTQTLLKAGQSDADPTDPQDLAHTIKPSS